MYPDVLLGAPTYPDAMPDCALRSGVGLASRLGQRLTLLSLEVTIPAMHNMFANALVDFDNLARQAHATSVANAEQSVACARLAAENAGVTLQATQLTALLGEEAEALQAAARTHDLCLVPVGQAMVGDEGMAEAVLFGSGRPIIIYSADLEVAVADTFKTIAIAWDGGPKAARAVADAMALLKRCGAVRILVATHEKAQAVSGVAGDLVRHLKAHGIDAVVDEVSSERESIGATFTRYVREHGVELLVMGGFGHARLREFVLGGATQSILDAPPCPVLLSH